MVQVISYVFIDLETTGLPSEEYNKTKITELSMVAVTREHLLSTKPGACPRVLDKLTLCFNPRKMVNPESTYLTGLDNYLLEHKTAFNADVINMINTFLKLLPQPVCLIAHNGMGFDFPVLKNHFDKLNMSLAEDVMCADCFHGFYDILEAKKTIANNLTHNNNATYSNIKEESCNVLTGATVQGNPHSNNDTLIEPDCSTELVEKTYQAEKALENSQIMTKRDPNNMLRENITVPFTDDSTLQLPAIDATDNIELNEIKLLNETTPKLSIQPSRPATPQKGVTVTDDSSFGLSAIHETDIEWKMIKLRNETTPKQPIRSTNPATSQKRVLRIEKARRRLPYSNHNKPKELYKLPLIYERVMNKTANGAHRAESDCIYALEIAVALGEDFVLWVDNNCCLFSDIKSMKLGTPVGF